jgi:hypothetical protein
MVAVALALALLLCLIWIDRSHRYEALFKSSMIAIVLAIALPHIGLIAMARLRRSYVWVRVATVLAIAALGLLIITMIIFEGEDEYLFRVMGAIAILDVCGTLTVPVLHRVSAIKDPVSIEAPILEIGLTCPRCRQTQQVQVGRSQCAGCGLRLLIEIDEERCEACGYVLYGIESTRCPECGEPIARSGSDEGGG